MISRFVRRIHSGEGPSFSKPISCRHQIDEWMLAYSFPTNRQNPALTSEVPINQINTATEHFDDLINRIHYERYVAINSRHWPYRGSFLQGAMGHLATLHCVVKVMRCVPQFVMKRVDVGCLESVIAEMSFDYFEKPHPKDSCGKAGFNYRLRQERETSSDYIPDECLIRLPTNFVREGINGQQWLSFDYGGHAVVGHQKKWAFPLNESHYLEFNFFLEPETGKNSIRLQRMREDAERIMSSVTISRVSQ